MILGPILALLGAAGSAHAAGMALRWGTCEGTSNRNFACDVDAGAEVLVASFSAPAGAGALSGVAAKGHISAAEGSVPPWWQMVNRGACRNSSLSVSFVMSDETECDDPWQGQGMGGIASYRLDEQGAEFQIAVAVPSSAMQSITSGRTYAAFKLFINHQRTTAGNCNGCRTPMCISLESMKLGQPNMRSPYEIELTDGITGMGGASTVVTWQGGTPRCGAGAAKPSTWTKLKKYYH